MSYDAWLTGYGNPDYTEDDARAEVEAQREREQAEIDALRCPECANVGFHATGCPNEVDNDEQFHTGGVPRKPEPDGTEAEDEWDDSRSLTEDYRQRINGATDMKACKNCGARFPADDDKQIFCSVRCEDDHNERLSDGDWDRRLDARRGR